MDAGFDCSQALTPAGRVALETRGGAPVRVKVRHWLTTSNLKRSNFACNIDLALAEEAETSITQAGRGGQRRRNMSATETKGKALITGGAP